MDTYTVRILARGYVVRFWNGVTRVHVKDFGLIMLEDQDGIFTTGYRILSGYRVDITPDGK